MSNRVRTVAAVVLTCLASMLAFGGASVAAQDDTATYDLQITTSQCEESPCTDDIATPIGDVVVYVTSADGTIDYGSCTTTIDADPTGCSVAVDPETSVEVTVDESTIPEGYVALDYPVVYDVPAETTEVGDVWIYFSPQEDTVPDDSDTDEEISDDESSDGTPAAELPSTGTGSESDVTTSTPLVLLGVLGAMCLIVSCGLIFTRRPHN